MMIKIRYYSFLLVAAFLLSQCASTKYTSPDQFPDAKITFGNGGGYAGLVTEYTLLENGQLFKKSSMDTVFQQLPKVKTADVKQIFNNYDFLKLEDISMNEPGNLYQFIVYQTSGKEHRITWSSENKELESTIPIFYSNLKRLVANQK